MIIYASYVSNEVTNWPVKDNDAIEGPNYKWWKASDDSHSNEMV